ncbi:transducin family protein [Actinidia rufa]|uniref:Transducin family protein n=1 Tax=Actinidia rufa TaxID=165716 RepID=A0A7J0H9S7_9ERIC|nr:transducin family protein [Actinidia rufa]
MPPPFTNPHSPPHQPPPTAPTPPDRSSSPLALTSPDSSQNLPSETKTQTHFKQIDKSRIQVLEIIQVPADPSPNRLHNLPLLLPRAAAHSATVTIFSSQTLEPKSTISSFADIATSASFRSDGRLLAAGSHSGIVQVFDVKSRTPLCHLRRHSRPVHLVCYPASTSSTSSPAAMMPSSDSGTSPPRPKSSNSPDTRITSDPAIVHRRVTILFVTGSYDHTIRLWDVRVSSGGSMMEVNHGKPVEDVIFLPSGGLIAMAGGDSVKIWDVIGGGKLLYSMERHNKTVTALCVGKIGKESGEEAQQNRILSVSLYGYMKVFDYAKFKITHSMRFPSPLLSVGFSPDCLTRIIGTSNGKIYAEKRKTKENVGAEVGNFASLGPISEPPKRVLRPSYFRYFHRGQNEKASEGITWGKNPENVVAVMEELVARKKLLRCVSNLETEELRLSLGFFAEVHDNVEGILET